MLLQANDYLWLHDHLGCELQMGGSDQWGNIVSGVDLIRRKRQVAVHALAWPLLTARRRHQAGQDDRRPPVARSGQDVAVPVPPALGAARRRELEQQFMFFSLRPLAEIAELLADHAAAPERRLAQRALADEVTALVHGAAAAAGGRRGRRRAVRRRSARRVGGGAGRRSPARCRRAGPTPTRARRRRRAARDHRAGHVEERRPAPAAAGRVRANGVLVGPDAGPAARCRCSTAATCCCARASARTTSWRFLRTKVDAPAARR